MSSRPPNLLESPARITHKNRQKSMKVPNHGNHLSDVPDPDSQYASTVFDNNLESPGRVRSENKSALVSKDVDGEIIK